MIKYGAKELGVVAKGANKTLDVTGKGLSSINCSDFQDSTLAGVGGGTNSTHSHIFAASISNLEASHSALIWWPF